MTMSQSVNDPRAAFRVLAAVFSSAVALSIQIAAPDFPEQLIVAWMGVFMAAIGFGEVMFDRRAGASPDAPIAVELVTPDPTDSEAEALPVEIMAVAPDDAPPARTTAAAPEEAEKP